MPGRQPRYHNGRSLQSRVPTNRGHHGHECHRQQATGMRFTELVPGYQHQFLVSGGHADGYDHATAGFELFEQGGRDKRRGGGHDDGVEGRLFRPPLETVATAGFDIVVAHILQPLPRRLGQRRDSLDAVNLARQAGKNRGLVPGSGTDFEHDAVFRELQHVSHQGDNVGL